MNRRRTSLWLALVLRPYCNHRKCSNNISQLPLEASRIAIAICKVTLKWSEICFYSSKHNWQSCNRLKSNRAGAIKAQSTRFLSISLQRVSVLKCLPSLLNFLFKRLISSCVSQLRHRLGARLIGSNSHRLYQATVVHSRRLSQRKKSFSPCIVQSPRSHQMVTIVVRVISCRRHRLTLAWALQRTLVHYFINLTEWSHKRALVTLC